MVQLPIKFISLENQSFSWRIPTNKDVIADATPGIWITGFRGLLEPGESTSESTPRSYSHGSVLDPNPTLSGKNIELDIHVGGVDLPQAKLLYERMVNTLTSMNMTLDTDWVGPYNVQYTRFDLDEDGTGQNGFFAGTIVLVAREAV